MFAEDADWDTDSVIARARRAVTTSREVCRLADDLIRRIRVSGESRHQELTRDRTMPPLG
jgi:hypothetical protein